VEGKITIDDVRNYILYNYHLSAANNIEMDLMEGEAKAAEKNFNKELMEDHMSEVEKYKLPEVVIRTLVVDNILAHAIEDLRRETKGIDLLPLNPNFDELKVKNIAKKIAALKSSKN
tara:strand:- start:23 stop:373 length:351 start_codon:yes stop_codon:yes gene_type:complete